jgi:hypothetical protein
VAVGDFNNDGIPDLAVADEGLNPVGGVSILLGNGNGTFQPAVNYAGGAQLVSVAVGDFNGDGLLDLAVVEGAQTGGSPGVSVLLGNGNGTFQAARTFNAGTIPVSVAVGDFTGDGRLDLAVANAGDSQGRGQGVSVLLGNGDGTFQAARTFDAGTQPRSVAVGDFNGDGPLDLAVADAGDSQGRGQGVSVLLGNGDGTFQPARTFLAYGPESVAVGDVNGDAIPDLAVGGRFLVSVLLGNGDGSFQAPRTFAAGSHTTSVTVGDFNGDGLLDLAVTDVGSYPDFNGTVNVFLGNGDGSFQFARTFAAGRFPQSAAVGDFNGDGLLDLAVADYGADYGVAGAVSVLLGNGDGSFQATPSYFAGTRPDSVAVGDFTGDGQLDLAVADQGDSQGRGEGVSVLLGNGDGTFQVPRTYAAGSFPDSVVVGDFNGDGILDVAVANGGSNNVSVLLGNGDGTFQAARSFSAGSVPESVAVGDFNGDGKLDLAVANYTISGTVSVLLGNGDGSFQTARTYPAGIDPVAVTVGDFNGDSLPDLAVLNRYSSNVSVLLGNGDGTFQAQRTFPAGNAPRSVAVGDFNSDGLLDLAVANYYTNTVSVLLGNGDGTFQLAQTFAAGGLPRSVAVGDFNGDGIPDLAVAGFSGTRVLLGNGDGSFQNPSFGYITGPSSAVVGDFNGNGLPDLAVTGNGVVNILTNDGIWDGPGLRGGRASGRPVVPRGSATLPPPPPEARSTDLPVPSDLPPKPAPPWPGPEEIVGSSAASEQVSLPRPVATLRPARAAEVLDVGWGLPDWRSGPVGTW